MKIELQEKIDTAIPNFPSYKKIDTGLKTLSSQEALK